MSSKVDYEVDAPITHIRGITPKDNSPFDIPQKSWARAIAFVPLYLSHVPVVQWLTKPNGYFTLLLDKTYGPRTSSTLFLMLSVAIFNVYIFTAVGSVIGQALGTPIGYKNKTPRLIKANLIGLPSRLASAHQALIEFFPAFAAVLIMVYVARPAGGEPATTLIDQLVFAFVCKTIYYPAYLLNDDLKSATHMFALGGIVGASWDLYKQS